MTGHRTEGIVLLHHAENLRPLGGGLTAGFRLRGQCLILYPLPSLVKGSGSLPTQYPMTPIHNCRSSLAKQLPNDPFL
jgi:hypothetical protein